MVLRRLIIGAVNGDRIDPAENLAQIKVELEVPFHFLHRPAQLLFQHLRDDVAADFAGAELAAIQMEQPFGVGGDFFLGNGAGHGRIKERQEQREHQRDTFHTIISIRMWLVILAGPSWPRCRCIRKPARKGYIKLQQRENAGRKMEAKNEFGPLRSGRGRQEKEGN